jgi:hypothetical protein
LKWQHISSKCILSSRQCFLFVSMEPISMLLSVSSFLSSSLSCVWLRSFYCHPKITSLSSFVSHVSLWCLMWLGRPSLMVRQSAWSLQHTILSPYLWQLSFWNNVSQTLDCFCFLSRRYCPVDLINATRFYDPSNSPSLLVLYLLRPSKSSSSFFILMLSSLFSDLLCLEVFSGFHRCWPSLHQFSHC